ncbi:cysteine desulfurase / selenocysteine lyase [Lachnospiraceae bacterium]|nr:cysteine desulfurase / selenocysteine lyase [Lachnospiraceae bacterium]
MKENQFRKDFPIFAETGVTYLDSAATSQRPQVVIDAEREFNEKMNANPLRGLYGISIEATDAYENARETVKEFIGADSAREIIFTRNASESLNLVAYSYACSVLKPGDTVLTTIMEHHSNILPWRMAAERTGARVEYLEPEHDGTFTDAELQKKIVKGVKIVAVGHVSNVLGCINPVKKISDMAHAVGAVTVVDAAQSAPHMKVDVKELGADFLVFSGHKLMAPFGIGVLYGRRELLEEMPPFLRGGEMIEYVTHDTEKWAELPHKFEAGTVNATGAYGLDRAIKYLKNVGFDFIRETEDRLTSIIFEEAATLPYFHILGSDDPKNHNGIVSFTIDGVHPHDISSILDGDKICIRAGHHCAQPLLEYLGESSTARASLYLYNTEEDVRFFMDKVKNIRGIMGYGN